MAQTQKIAKFDKQSARQVGEESLKLLKTLAESLGVTVVPAGGTFDDGKFVMKVEWRLATVDGEDAAKVEFVKYCEMYGLKAEDYGREFPMPGGMARIVGLAPRRRTKPIVFEYVKSPGKKLITADDYVRKCLGRKYAWEDKEPFIPVAAK